MKRYHVWMPPFAIACVGALQGFAAFYRHEGKWKGREHIHAIYALLPMKRQLRGQVREFLAMRRATQKPKLKWAREYKWK